MVNANSLDNALPYLACPECKRELTVQNEYKSASGNIEQGALVCSCCDKKYEITDGVVSFFDGSKTNLAKMDVSEIVDRIGYFFNGAETQAKRAVSKIKKDTSLPIIEDGARVLTYFDELADALSEKGISNISVMKAIFSYGENLIRDLPRDATYEDKCAKILQATSTARYNRENYRGCYVLPEEVMGYLQNTFSDSTEGLIFDGATATGNNLEKMIERLDAEDSVGIGIDLSAKMIREAQKKANDKENLFYAQGNLECLPLKDDIAKVVSINNALDRLPQPRKVASEIDRISKSGCLSALFNCSPLQFVSPDGTVYVPEEMRMDLIGMTEASGFDVAKVYGVDVLSPWEPSTIFDGQERLPMEGVIGMKRSR